MSSNPDNKLFLDLAKLDNALGAFADLPSEIKGSIDMDQFIEYIDLLLNANVFPDEIKTFPENVESPDDSVLDKLRKKGFDIAEDGIIEKFHHERADTRVLQFFARLARGMFYLNKYIGLIGLDNVKKGIFGRSDTKMNAEAKSDVITFGILYLEYFFKLMEFAYSNFTFTKENSVIPTGKAIGYISGNIFRGINSLLGKWYGGGMTDFAEYVRTSIGATFSAWLVLKQRYPGDFDIRPANEKEDLDGIDFVISKNGKIIKYVQCKARKESDGRSSAYVSFDGKTESQLVALNSYIDEANYDEQRAFLMKKAAKDLALLCSKDNVEWEWVFVPSNYYINI